MNSAATCWPSQFTSWMAPRRSTITAFCFAFWNAFPLGCVSSNTTKSDSLDGVSMEQNHHGREQDITIAAGCKSHLYSCWEPSDVGMVRFVTLYPWKYPYGFWYQSIASSRFAMSITVVGNLYQCFRKRGSGTLTGSGWTAGLLKGRTLFRLPQQPARHQEYLTPQRRTYPPTNFQSIISIESATYKLSVQFPCDTETFYRDQHSTHLTSSFTLHLSFVGKRTAHTQCSTMEW